VVYTWGQGEDGQLGLGDSDSRTVPCPVNMRSAISRDRTQGGSEASADNATMLEVACGAEHTLVILSSDGGPLACSWGECVPCRSPVLTDGASPAESPISRVVAQCERCAIRKCEFTGAKASPDSRRECWRGPPAQGRLRTSRQRPER